MKTRICATACLPPLDSNSVEATGGLTEGGNLLPGLLRPIE